MDDLDMIGQYHDRDYGSPEGSVRTCFCFHLSVSHERRTDGFVAVGEWNDLHEVEWLSTRDAPFGFFY